jgi:hypothetical protein
MPTLIVEGVDDMYIYRNILNIIGPTKIIAQGCGGRSILLDVYKRKNEFMNTKVIFIADKDVWVYSNTPEQYIDIIWTEGYSIENDLFSGAKETIYKLFNEDERKRYEILKSSLLPWYVSQVEKYFKGESFKLNHKIWEIIERDSLDVKEHILSESFNEAVDLDLKEKIVKNYNMLLRGKLIFDMLVLFLSDSNRKPKYSREHIFDLCIKMPNDKKYIDRYINRINEIL